MFEAFLYKSNDKYNIFDEEDLKIRLALTKPLLIQKAWWYILLLIFFISMVANDNMFYLTYSIIFSNFMWLIGGCICLVLGISLIMVLARSVYWYRLKVEEDDDSKTAIYSKYIVKKWISLIGNLMLVFGYIGYLDGDSFRSMIFISVLFLNIVRLILKIIGSKISLSMIKATLENVTENVDEENIKQIDINEFLEIDDGVELFFGTRYIAITNRLKLLLFKLEEATLSENISINSKSQLITNLSHDLKTPLTSIINSTYILKTEKLNEEEKIDQINILKNKTHRLNSLIKNMNDIINSDEEVIVVNKESLYIGNLLENTIENFKDRIEESNLDLRLNIEEENIILNLDKDKTTRIFENLLDNIIKYSLEGTRVYIDLENKDDKVELNFKNVCKYEIDTNENTLTNRFVKGDKSRHSEGYGLGLSIVNNLVKVQGGKIKIDVEGDLFKATIIFNDTKK
ncbi:MAG: sensor histidine kinase [Paraclostridium sp.]|uniref:sensor histidine kinase n=1 Tax=Paraclostridium sp. TaxID=2023273 RepID=UPI003F2C62FB